MLVCVCVCVSVCLFVCLSATSQCCHNFSTTGQIFKLQKSKVIRIEISSSLSCYLVTKLLPQLLHNIYAVIQAAIKTY